MNIRALVEQMIQDGAFNQVINNPLAQFGTEGRRYLGAELLPEQPRTQNEYREDGIKYRTIVANDGTRYSPVQIKEGTIMGSFLVELGESDIGSELKAAQYDAFIRLLSKMDGGGSRPSMEAVAEMTRWADTTLMAPLVEKNERMRWEAIVDAKITRTGDDNYEDIVNLSDPNGHRVTAAAAWSNDATDPYEDIMAGVEHLASKGFTVNRIVTSSAVRAKLALNEKIRTRVGSISIASGTVVGLSGRASLAAMSAMLGDDGLPPIDLYDLQYRTQNGTGYFLKRDVFVLVASTMRDERIDLGDDDPVVLSNTLGYTGIGVPAGQTDPGRVVKVRPMPDSKPPRIEGEAWQTSLPVIAEPEAIYVIKGIT